MHSLDVVLPDRPTAWRLAADLVDGLQLPPPTVARAVEDGVLLRIRLHAELVPLVRDVVGIHGGRIVGSVRDRDGGSGIECRSPRDGTGTR